MNVMSAHTSFTFLLTFSLCFSLATAAALPQLNVTLPVDKVKFGITTHPRNLTFMKYGDALTTLAQVVFPPGDTNNMTFEIFLFGEEPFAVELVDFRVLSVGSCLTMSAGTMKNINDAVIRKTHTNATCYETAFMFLGSSTNDAACVDDLNLDEVSLTFTYSVLMSKSEFTGYNNSNFSLVCGSAYMNYARIWIVAETLVLHYADEAYSNSSSAEMSHDIILPDSFPIGLTSAIVVNAYIPDLYFNLTVDLFIPTNVSMSDDLLTMCDVSIVDVGDNFQFFDRQPVRRSRHLSPSKLTTEQLIVQYPNIINFGYDPSAAETSLDNLIALQFCIPVSDNAELIGETASIGAAIYLGNSFLVADIPLNITDRPPSEKMSKNPNISSYTSSDSIGPQEVLTYTVMMDIPRKTNYHYKAESLVLFDTNNPKLQVCGANIIEHGANLPCFGGQTTTTTYRRHSADYVNHLQKDLGYIANVGSVNDTSADSLKVELYYSLTDGYVPDPNTDANTSNVVVGIQVGEDSIWVILKQLNITEVPGGNNTLSYGKSLQDLLTFSVSKSADSVSVGEQFTIWLRMYVHPGLKLSNFTIDVSTNTSLDAVLLELTGFKVVSVGSSIPCLFDSSFQKNLKYIQSTNSGFNDKAEAQLDSITSVGQADDDQLFNQTARNLVTFEVNFTVISAPKYISNVKAESYYNVMTGTEQVWDGESSIEVDYIPKAHPQLVLENHTSVEVGQLLLYPVKVQLSGKGPTTYNMSLTGVNDVLSLCHVRLSSQPPGISMVTLGTTENQLISTANFTYNPGTDSSNSYTSLELTFYIKDSVREVNREDSVQLLLEYDGYTILQDVTVSTIQQITPSAPTSLISSHLERLRIDATEVSNSLYFMPGEAIRIRFTVEFDRDYSDYYSDNITIRLSSPTNKPYHLCSIQSFKLASYDEEAFPCVLPNDIDQVITNADMVEGNVNSAIDLNLGFVCLSPPVNSTQTKFKMVFEGFANARRSFFTTTIALLEATFHTAKGSASKSVLNLTRVLDPLTYNGLTNITGHDLAMSSSTMNNSVAINEYFTVDMKFFIPLRSNVYIEISLSQPDSSFQYSDSIQVVSAGANVAGVYEQELELQPIAYINRTQQIGSAAAVMGVVTSPGTQLSRTEANDVTVKLKMMFVDSAHTTNQSEHSFTIDILYNGGRWKLSHTVNVTALRTGTEQPHLSIAANSDCSSPLTNGDVFNINFDIKHMENSTAVATNVTVAILLTPFLGFSSITEFRQNIRSSDSPKVEIQKSIRFIIPELTMFESLSVMVELKVVPVVNKFIPLNSVHIPWVLSYDTYQRPNNLYTGAVAPMSHVTCNISVTGSKPFEGCANVEALGMAANRVNSSQILALPVAPGHDVGDLRPPRKMKFGERKPYAMYNQHRYVEIDLLALHYVQSIVIGSNTPFFDALVHTSKDGKTWTSAIPVSGLTYTSEQPITVNRLARHVKVIFSSPPSLEINMEMFGCLQESKYRTAFTKPKEFQHAPRQVLASETELYICDSKPEKGFPPTCLVKSLITNTWSDMDPRIQNLIGLNSDVGYAFGLTKSGKYMMTRNGGNLWTNISPKLYQSFSIDIPPLSLPWENLTQDVLSTPHKCSSPDGTHTFAATDDGLHQLVGGVWKRVVDWETCC